MAELKLKMVSDTILTFSILALPLEVTFYQYTFYIYGPFVKKGSLRLLKDGILIEILNKMYKRVYFEPYASQVSLNIQ